MATRRRRSERARTETSLDARADEGPAEVVRRAPFADNPRVGTRGQRTRQRILDAALEAFGAGYERCGVDAIAGRADCSRAAFYQYFSSKEDVFRELAGQVARALNASTEALGPLQPDRAGWLALRAWVGRHAEIYARYEPVFHAYRAASESDEAVATGSARWGVRTLARIRARLVEATPPSRVLDPVIMQLLESVTQTHDLVWILRSALPGQYAADRVGDALADVLHRSLFGLQRDVNVHPPATRRPPRVRFDPALRDAFAQGEPPAELTAAGRRTWETLLDAGRKVLVERGYHGARVADVVGAAGVSRGAFYRYFADKDQLARVLAMRAMRTVALVLAEIPAAAADGSVAGRTALRRWLLRYGVTQVDEAAMLRVWVDAALQDPALRAGSAPALDWGRRVMVSFLERRGFGDVPMEALVLVALLSSFGARERTPGEVDAAAFIVEQGLLGLGRR